MILGVSGGADSVFLFHMLREFAKNFPLDIIVAHMNHQLRAEESDQDEEFVKKLVAPLEAEVASKDIAGISKKKKRGIEETARAERYAFFNRLSEKYDAPSILTAHHADDNLETILFNFTRGATLKGLTGMQICEPPLLRPLLYTTKEQILSYLKLKKIRFRTDKSNLSKEFTRNKIRLSVLPHLLKINPNLAGTTAKNIKNLREISDFLDKTALTIIAKISENSSYKKIDTIAFRKLDIALQKAVIRTLYKHHTGTTENLETAHIDEILNIIHANIGNKSKKFGKLSFKILSNKLILSPRKNP